MHCTLLDSDTLHTVLYSAIFPTSVIYFITFIYVSYKTIACVSVISSVYVMSIPSTCASCEGIYGLFPQLSCPHTPPTMDTSFRVILLFK